MSNNQAAQPGNICPFSMGNPNGPQLCNPGCKLFRAGNPGYECYFQELQSISWNTKRSAGGAQSGPYPNQVGNNFNHPNQ